VCIALRNDATRVDVELGVCVDQQCLLVVCRDSVDGHLVTPATVSEVVNMGWTVKYVLKFDDDVEVSQRQ
jgi:hypothetical protein